MSERPTLIVCGACGRVRGEARGWDTSCATHAIEVWADSVVRDGGLVTKADATGRILEPQERWPSP